MALNEFENKEPGSASSGIEGNPESKEGKVSYGDTSTEQEQKEKEGFPSGSYDSGSEGSKDSILNDGDGPND